MADDERGLGTRRSLGGPRVDQPWQVADTSAPNRKPRQITQYQAEDIFLRNHGTEVITDWIGACTICVFMHPH
jgi:hypothetical protein